MLKDVGMQVPISVDSISSSFNTIIIMYFIVEGGREEGKDKGERRERKDVSPYVHMFHSLLLYAHTAQNKTYLSVHPGGE